MPRCDDCSNRRCSCAIVDGDNTEVLGTGSAADPYRINATGGDGASLWESGDIKPTARGVASTGWLLCNGAAVSRDTYAGLFAAIGEQYGPGDGANTFNLPDLAGRFPFGFDGGHPRGSVGGQEDIALAITNLPAHDHTISHVHAISHDHPSSTSGAVGNHTHGLPNHKHDVKQSNAAGTNNGTFARGAAQDRLAETEAKTDFDTNAAGAHSHTVDTPAYYGNSAGPSAGSSGSTGSGLPFTNMPPYVAINYVIKT